MVVRDGGIGSSRFYGLMYLPHNVDRLPPVVTDIKCHVTTGASQCSGDSSSAPSCYRRDMLSNVSAHASSTRESVIEPGSKWPRLRAPNVLAWPVDATMSFVA